MSVLRAHRVASGLRSLVGAVTVVGVAATGLLVVPSPAPVVAAPGDGTVAVRVVQDFNANGNWDDPLVEPGLAGVLVDFADAAGTVRTVPTDGAGVATLTAPPGAYRVVVHNPDPARYRPAFASEATGTADTPDDTRLSSTDEFVTLAADQTLQVTTAFWDPADYCQANPLVADACQQPLYASNGSLIANADTQTLFTAPYRGTGANVDVKQVSRHAETGTVYGIGWRKQDRRLFAGAFAKRGAAYGPAGPGAIYVTSIGPDGTPSGPTALWGVVPDAGSTEHNLDVAGRRMDWDFAAVVGKEALGDLDVSEDGERLHVLNLHTRQLFVYDATAASMGAPMRVVDLPDPGCAATADWRPGALAERHGTLYVGGVCSAETSRSRADLRTIVVTLDADSYTPTGTVLDQPMMIRRQRNWTCGGPLNGFTQWNPWSMEVGCTPTTGQLVHATPWLGDIVVENNGDLVLGFRDRSADQHGYSLPYFAPTNSGSTPDGMIYVTAAGDITRACRGTGGDLVLDHNGACGVTAVPETTIAGEFFTGDVGAVHPEAAYGGLALSRAERGIASSWMDPAGAINTGGYGRVDRFNGLGVGYTAGGRTADSTPVWGNNRGNQVTAGGAFGKGQGMADLEVLCDLAPLQIGNRVWMDPDRDGIQDPDEQPIPGVTVNLYDATGGLVATTVTNARGEYYFDSLHDGLLPETSYVIRLDDAANYGPGAPLDADVVRLTLPDRGTGADQNRLDSDGRTVDGYPQHAIVTGPSGSVDHTYDFGFGPPPPSVSVGDLVWLDIDEDGLQDDGEPGIEGVVLVLTGPDGQPVTDVDGDPVGPVATDADGHYSFDDLPPLPPGQHYTVSIDRAADGTRAALDGLGPTAPGAGGRDEDSSTWSAESADLTQDGARDATLDFGFHPVRVPPPAPAAPRVETTTSHARAGVGTELYDVVRIEGLRPGGSSVGTATLHGPFTSPAALACTPATAVGSVTFAPVNGIQHTPTVRVDAPGYYTWQVTLAADEHNRAATHPCGLASETSLITRAANPVRVIDTGFAGRSGASVDGRGVLPTRLRLPAVGIDAAVVPAGLKGRRARVPARPSITGWLDTSARIDDVIGTAVIVGHVSDRHDRPGALVDLGRARKGQRVTLRDSAGTLRAYRVRRLRTFDRARPLPTGLFRMTGSPRVQLVTCTDRVVDRHGRFHYRRNLVVTLVPVGGQ
ncbi:SdrD B-like domain-containing protein [Nocardioides sp. BYT-33-1]|uniref:SdrD B-like domain-containing protein n=1 Tax=Nocardioides sp. BYT-33-1 TaxID=3416952 RepID=UPI003F52C889